MIRTLITTALLMFAAVAFAADANQSQFSSHSGIGEAPDAIVVDLHAVPDASSAYVRKHNNRHQPSNPYYTEEQVRAMKTAAITAAPISRPEDGALDMKAAKTQPDGPQVSSGFIGFEGSNEEQTACAPSDTPIAGDVGLAVSPKWVVQVTSSCLLITDKTGGSRVQKTLGSLFGRDPNTTDTYEPRITYDFVKTRFVAIAATIDSTGTYYIDVAASATSDPNGTWHVYHMFTPSGTTNVVFPTLGQSWANDKYNAGIFVCWDHSGSNSRFDTAYCYFLPKTQIYKGASFTFYYHFNFTYNGAQLSSIQPVNVSQIDEQPRAEYAVASINTNNNANGLQILSFANIVAQSGSPGPYVTSVHVPTPSSYNYPANANNAGFCSNCINTFDNRITGTVQYAGGRIYPTINTANGGASAVLGWVVRPFLNDNGGGCTGSFTNACAGVTGATIETEFCYGCGEGSGGLGAYYGTIAADEEGNWTMFANYSDKSRSPGTIYSTNRVSWQTPFHDVGFFSCQTNSSYTQSLWGEYTAAAPDYNEKAGSTAFWGSGMYLLSDGNWDTCIAANRYGSVEIP
jgi:hypothetical protein